MDALRQQTPEEGGVLFVQVKTYRTMAESEDMLGALAFLLPSVGILAEQRSGWSQGSWVHSRKVAGLAELSSEFCVAVEGASRGEFEDGGVC